MKSFKNYSENDEILEETPKEAVDEAATMGDLVLGLGAVGALWALKKGWDKFGKGGKLARTLAITQKGKAQVAKDAEEKRKGKVDDASAILNDPKASEKDKAKAQKTLDKHQTDTEKQQAVIDKDKAAQDKKDTAADAKAITTKQAQDKFDQSRKKHGADAQPPKGYSLDPEDKSGKTVIPTADAVKKKVQATKARLTKKLKPKKLSKADKAQKAKDSGLYGKGGSQKKKDRKAAAKKELEKRAQQNQSFIPIPSTLSGLEEEDRTQLLEELVLEETMTLQESEELQAIMALDDAKIKADINRKGQVVVKKKDLKKAEKILKKEFSGRMKTLMPKLVGEEVLEDGTDAMVNQYKNDTPGQRTAWEVVSKARARISEAVDAEAARELYLFIQNERDLMRQKSSIIKNIARKMKSGKYDHKQAPKLWMYWIESGAKLYDKMYSSPGVKTFDKDTKMSVAIQLADEMKTEIELGNYS